MDNCSPHPDTILPVVVGASLQAERLDRPLAYELAGVAMDRLAADELVPVVVSDLWYLNQPQMRLRPTIAVGPPERNAATAFLATRLPTVMVVEGRFRVHLDPELIKAKACFWGVNEPANAAALEAFIDRYLDDLLHQAAPPVHA